MDQLHFYYPSTEDDVTDPRKSKSLKRIQKNKNTDVGARALPDQRDLATQLVISGSLGLSAFVAFGILRPRWKSLYAARKRQRPTASSLPDLPDTFFGWIPVLYRITGKQVLASAGLDAWVVCTISQ